MEVVVSYKYETNPCLSSLLCNQVVTGLVNCPMAPAPWPLLLLVALDHHQDRQQRVRSNDEVRKVC